MRQTVYLGILVNYEQYWTDIEKMPLSKLSGSQALKLQKTLKKIWDEVNTFKEKRDQYIRENGTEHADGSISIEDEETAKVAQNWVNELLRAEVDVTWKPIFDDEDLLERVMHELDWTLNDLLIVEAAGLVSTDNNAESERA